MRLLLTTMTTKTTWDLWGTCSKGYGEYVRQLNTDSEHETVVIPLGTKGKVAIRQRHRTPYLFE